MSEPVATSGTKNGQGAHILVIDDDEDILRLLSMRLKASGYRVSAAGSVEERMLRLQRKKKKLADAIFADGGSAAAGLSEHDIDDLLAPLG